jgi:hypothetical protein
MAVSRLKFPVSALQILPIVWLLPAICALNRKISPLDPTHPDSFRGFLAIESENWGNIRFSLHLGAFARASIFPGS